MSQEKTPFLKQIFMQVATIPALLTTILKSEDEALFRVAEAGVKGANLYDKITGQEPRNTVGQELEYQKKHPNGKTPQA